MFRFQREKAQDVFQEMIPLLHKHWNEIEHYKDMPLDPDFETYFRMEDADILRVFTARRETDGKLVGYAVFFVKVNLHYKNSLQALQDVLYIDPSARGMFGVKFITWTETQLKRENIQVVYQHIKIRTSRTVDMFKRMGYTPIDLILGKRLDGG